VGGFVGLFWLIAVGLPLLFFAFAPDGPPGSFRRGWFPWPIFLAIGVITLVLLLRALRRTALPLGEIMGATDRIAEGDYQVRVTERGTPEVRALARAVNAMAERLQVNEDQRRTVLASVTHELRTPLTVIQGNLEGLIDGVYPADEAHLQTILEETHVLARRIDDLRTLALAESGALRLHREPTDLAALVGETVAAFQVQADEAGISLRIESDPDLATAEVDPARIRELLENLLTNALRYTPRDGTITVRCLRSEAASAAAQVVLEVVDTGPGIPPADLPHVFDRFFKGSDSQGMGLGLAIARNLAVAHGGEITAESPPGKGTTMQVTLPLV
jgi:two-component system, OmpR family, sensor histidine kinase BaeS